METVVLTVHLLLALALIVVVLLQRSEGGGLGIGGGGGMMTGRSAATALSKVTWALGIAFVITSLGLTIIAARQDGAGSVIDQLGVELPETPSPATPPAPAGDLLPPAGALPPATSTSPATPPAADAPATPPAAD